VKGTFVMNDMDGWMDGGFKVIIAPGWSVRRRNKDGQCMSGVWRGWVFFCWAWRGRVWARVRCAWNVSNVYRYRLCKNLEWLLFGSGAGSRGSVVDRTHSQHTHGSGSPCRQEPEEERTEDWGSRPHMTAQPRRFNMMPASLDGYRRCCPTPLIFLAKIPSTTVTMPHPGNSLPGSRPKKPEKPLPQHESDQFEVHQA
jgi:hypothetical protein